MQIVAVANDITFNSGAFGTKEDAVFRAATEHALEEKLPLFYLAANAGARVGLAQEVKQCLQVCLTSTLPPCPGRQESDMGMVGVVFTPSKGRAIARLPV